MPSRDELFLAYRQAKTALFFERRGVGLMDLARFEYKLKERLDALAAVLLKNGGWFDELPRGELWIVPKKLHTEKEENGITHIGAKRKHSDLEVQIRYIPSPECAIVEVLFLWQFGPALQSILSKSAVGYRLDVRKNSLSPTRRWLFDYWPKRYDEFRTVPVDEAMRELEKNGSVLLLSADLANFYDTIDPSFLLSEEFVAELNSSNQEIDFSEYERATNSLLGYYSNFQHLAKRRTGLEWSVGIPIGSLTSRVVANLALATLDRDVEKREETLCYRRYVDDFVIVSRADQSNPERLDDVVRKYVPHICGDDDGVFRLAGDSLLRKGSEFAIRREKCNAYHLAGTPGRAFLSAIREDFGCLVSENRTFLDPSVLLDGVYEGKFENLVRAGVPGRPLTVLRDVDRSRLEHYALSTRLRSLERVSVLVDSRDAIRLVRSALDEVLRFLEGDGDWVENLEAAIRMLRLGIRTGNWDDTKRLIDYMDGIWKDTTCLREFTRRLVHRKHEITRRDAWVWLRNYLHARRAEAICCAIRQPSGTDEFPDWLRLKGVRDRTEMVRWRAFVRRARLLAAADLRSLDREDDAFGPNTCDMKPGDSYFGHDDAKLNERLEKLVKFVDICKELGDKPWEISAASLFLCTRPPSYFDVARRWLYRSEERGFDDGIFEELLGLVNAIRGTEYTNPVGKVIDKHTVRIPNERLVDQRSGPNPRLILGNLVSPDEGFVGAAKRVNGSLAGKPILTVGRLRSLASILASSSRLAKRESCRNLLILPELSLPRAWFRSVANHISRSESLGLVVGLEYLHHPTETWVFNQAWTLVPGPFHSVATWPWTKAHPAKAEAEELSRHGVSFRPDSGGPRRRRTVVDSPYGRVSILICSELIETRTVSDLLGRVEIVAVPSWNTDTSSYDHLIQSAGLQLHSIIAVANNGAYSDCRAWAPRSERWKRDLCRLIERNENGVVFAEIPLSSLRAFREESDPGIRQKNPEWKPLPPYWPRADGELPQ